VRTRRRGIQDYWGATTGGEELSRSADARAEDVDEGVLYQGRRWKKSQDGDVLVWDKRRARWKPWRPGSGVAPPPELRTPAANAGRPSARPGTVFPDASQPAPWFEASTLKGGQGSSGLTRRWLVWLVALIAGAAIGGAITYSLMEADLRVGARDVDAATADLDRARERIGELERELERRDAAAGWQDVKVWSGYGSLRTEPVKVPRGRVRLAYSFFGTPATTGTIGFHAPNQDYLRTEVNKPGTFWGVTPFRYAGRLSLNIDGAEWVVRLQRFQ
jgi:hypothetical protein